MHKIKRSGNELFLRRFFLRSQDSKSASRMDRKNFYEEPLEETGKVAEMKVPAESD